MTVSGHLTVGRSCSSLIMALVSQPRRKGPSHCPGGPASMLATAVLERAWDLSCRTPFLAPLFTRPGFLPLSCGRAGRAAVSRLSAFAWHISSTPKPCPAGHQVWKILLDVQVSFVFWKRYAVKLSALVDRSRCAHTSLPLLDACMLLLQSCSRGDYELSCRVLSCV